jgi:formamidopyrimidine-DNA glycosylase
MPELPEVETIRRELDKEVAGKRIKTVEVTNNRSIRRHANKKQFISRLEGTKITGAQRRGKYLLLALDSGDLLVAHLGMSGQLLRTHVVITFTQHGQLRFLDPRTFGEMFVTTPDELTQAVPELATLGVDPVDTPMNWTDFGRMLLAHHMKLKAFLMDQSILAGIGNIYSDEILFDAGLRYDRMTDELTTQEIRRLYRAVVGILHDALKFGGSTLADEQYVDIHAKAGEYQEHHMVYARDKQPCLRCRGTVAKAKFQSRTTYFCPDCQV